MNCSNEESVSSLPIFFGTEWLQGWNKVGEELNTLGRCAACLPATSVKQGILNSALIVMGVWTRLVTHLIYRMSCDFT